jgi:hypothetical protein
MRQSASTHSLIPVRANPSDITTRQQKTEPPVPPPNPLSSTGGTRQPPPIMAQRGLGISVSPPKGISRVPVRALDNSVFANATMVHAPPAFNSSSTRSAQNSASEYRAAARAQKTNNTLSEPFRTPVLGGKDGFEDPSPTYSNSISPAFIVRNLDEDPHTGLTPVSQSFEEKKKPKGASRLSQSQLPSPPSSPPELATSRIPRRSQDDLSLKDTSRKLQEASSTGVRPRRISIPR